MNWTQACSPRPSTRMNCDETSGAAVAPLADLNENTSPCLKMNVSDASPGADSTRTAINWMR